MHPQLVLYEIKKADPKRTDLELKNYCLDFYTKFDYHAVHDVLRIKEHDYGIEISEKKYKLRGSINEILSLKLDDVILSSSKNKGSRFDMSSCIYFYMSLESIFYQLIPWSNYKNINQLITDADNHHKLGYLAWEKFKYKYKDKPIKVYFFKPEKGPENAEIKTFLENPPTKIKKQDLIGLLERDYEKVLAIKESTLNAETAWALVKDIRARKRQLTPISVSPSESQWKINAFTYVSLNRHLKILHQLDLNVDPKHSLTQKHDENLEFLLDEAIASSRHEGAHTTRRAAKLLLETGREVKTVSERMIVNNYQLIEKIAKTYKNEKLDLKLLLEIHKDITKGTLDNPEYEGRLRDDLGKDPLHIAPKGQFADKRVSFVAPEMSFVRDELPKLFNFINNEETESNFIHPIIKAILLHFWIAYLHPFEDGNGRTARALFYWYLLRENYSEFKLIPISVFIESSPDQYSMAFINSEQDAFDLTYFIDYNLRKIKEAQLSSQKKLKAKAEEHKADTLRLRPKAKNTNFNQRQIDCLRYLYKDPQNMTNVKSYSLKHSVTKATAVADLKGLMQKGYLYNYKDGRNVFYQATDKLKAFFLTPAS